MSEFALFLGLAVGLTILIACFVVWPLLSSRTGAHANVEHDTAQRASLREANAAIDADLAAGAINAEQADMRRAELLTRARAEATATSHAPLRNTPKQFATALACAFAIAGVGAALYATMGKREGLTAAKRSPPAQAQVTPEQIVQMVTRLEARLTLDAPKAEDLPQWKMLARSQMMLGNADKAVAALRTVLKLGGATAESEANLAEALLAQREGKPNDEIMTLLSSAYSKAPTDQKVLWLNAAMAQERGDKKTAVKFLNELLPTVAPDSQESADIKRFIGELSK